MSTQPVDKVKKAYSITKYTSAQLEQLARCLDNPTYFIENFTYIQHPKQGKLRFDLFPYQREMIDVMHNNRKSIFLTGRQMGKCVTYDTYITYNGEKREIGSLVKQTTREKIVSFLEKILLKLAQKVNS